MKTIMPSGYVAIITDATNAPFRFRGHHWPDHAVSFYGESIDVTGSGAYVVSTEFALKSLNSFFYAQAIFGTYLDAYNFTQQVHVYVNKYGDTGWFGLFFNAQWKGNFTDKVLSTNWAAWLASH